MKTAKTIVKETSKVIAPEVETAKKAATKVEVKAAVKEEVKTPAVEISPVVEKTNETVKSAPAKKTLEKKAAPAKKAPAKKIPEKSTVIKETVFLQYLGKEINHQDIVKQVKEIWTKSLKKKVGDIKSITIYFKPEENAAYYVVNDDASGSIPL